MSGLNGDGRPLPQPAVAVGVLTVVVDDAGSLYAMRAAVAAHAAEFGLTGAKLASLLVVANELATNTLRHGGGSGVLRLWRDGDAVKCEVRDNGPGIADPQHAGTHPIALNSDGGRGLWLSRQLSDHLVITNRNPGCTLVVTMTM